MSLVERIQAIFGPKANALADLEQNLRRIKRLRDGLETREGELKALESDEQLAELDADIREDLLD